MKLRAGDWVEVRSKDEILRTLDKQGRLGELPFMPQMFQYCGQRFKVYKRAHKTCDTVNQTGGRRLANGVHLELRCDGKSFAGCQAACLIFWKEAWLKPIAKRKSVLDAFSGGELRRNRELASQSGCSEVQVRKATRVEDQPSGDVTRYVCQATQLPYFTTPLPWWDFRQYLQDSISRNVTLGRMFCSFIYAGYHPFTQPKRTRLAPLLRRVYDRFQALYGGVPFPRRTGSASAGQSTATQSLNLQPGELVRVKSYKDILATLNSANMNRGLLFDAELVPYCGGTYRVKDRVSNFIDEKTGKVTSLKTPAVILENVWCRSRYSHCRLFCPRSIYSWWREVWLERVAEIDSPRVIRDLIVSSVTQPAERFAADETVGG